MSSSLLLRQSPACLVRLTWIVFVMRGRWPYSWCFVGCCLQDLFNKGLFQHPIYIYIYIVYYEYYSVQLNQSWEKFLQDKKIIQKLNI